MAEIVTLTAKILILVNISSTGKLVGKRLNSIDEVRSFEKGKMETVTLGENGVTIDRSTYVAGWSWEKCVQPVVKINSCEGPHIANSVHR